MKLLNSILVAIDFHPGTTSVLLAASKLADSYRRLGDMTRAEASQRTAKQVRDQLNVQQVEVSIRRRHQFWRNSLPRR